MPSISRHARFPIIIGGTNVPSQTKEKGIFVPACDVRHGVILVGETVTLRPNRPRRPLTGYSIKLSADLPDVGLPPNNDIIVIVIVLTISESLFCATTKVPVQLSLTRRGLRAAWLTFCHDLCCGRQSLCCVPGR